MAEIGVGGDRQAIIDAARGLETALVQQMLSAMARAQLEGDGFFGSGSGSGAMQSTFDMMLEKVLGPELRLGLAEKIADELGSSDPQDRAIPDLSTGGRQDIHALIQKVRLGTWMNDGE